MKKIKISFILVFVLLAINVFLPLRAEATVGGPTTIGDFKYNSVDESIYYTLSSAGGRGCPPMLYKKSIISGESINVYSCEAGEKFSRENPDLWVGSEISKITQNFENLRRIDFMKNKITFNINFIKENNLDNSEFLRNREFLVSVYQNNKKIDDFSVMGCELEQPFLFAGYSVPGIVNKIVLLLSAKSDCFEGGYIGERLFVVEGIENLDLDFFSNAYKSISSPLVPDIGTLLVHEFDTREVIDDTDVGNKDTKEGLDFDKFELIALGLALVISFVLGLILGKINRKNKIDTINSDSGSNIIH